MTDPLIPDVKYATLITEGDGVKTEWEINFAGGYISKDHVKAFTEDKVTGQLVIRTTEFVGPNTVRIAPAVANGLRLVIYRDTPKTEPIVNYTDGSVLSETNIDKSNRQAVFIAAELADRVIGDYDFSNSLLYAVNTATAAMTTANGVDAKATASLEISNYLVSTQAVSVLKFMTPAERADVLSYTGALDVGAACDAARDFALAGGRGGQLVFPKGKFSRSTTWDFSYPGLSVTGDGRMSTILKYTGGGTAVRVADDRPNNNTFAFTTHLRSFCIEGTVDTRVNLYLKNVNHAYWSDINIREGNFLIGVAFLIEGSVAGYFSNIVCSSNAQLMASRPYTGLVVDRDLQSGARATDNVFMNPIFEGAGGDSFQLVNSDQSLFIGGTGENNGGNGVTIAPGSRMNTFISVGFENSGFANIFDGGYSNRFLNCYTNKRIYIDSSALFSKVEGGFHQSITDLGSFSTIQDLKYSFFQPGGALSVSSTSSSRNTFNSDLGALTFSVKSPIPITPTGSPYEYVNGSGLDLEVIVSGGTVSQVVFGRSGGAVATLPTSGMFRLAPTDSITISYSIPPTMVAIPFGTNYI